METTPQELFARHGASKGNRRKEINNIHQLHVFSANYSGKPCQMEIFACTNCIKFSAHCSGKLSKMEFFAFKSKRHRRGTLGKRLE